jgi:hypothetical protein
MTYPHTWLLLKERKQWLLGFIEGWRRCDDYARHLGSTPQYTQMVDELVALDLCMPCTVCGGWGICSGNLVDDVDMTLVGQGCVHCDGSGIEPNPSQPVASTYKPPGIIDLEKL